MDRKKLIIIAGAVIGLVFVVVIGIILFSGGGTPKNGTGVIDCLKDPSNPACVVDCELDPENEACLGKVVNDEANITIWGVFDESSFFDSAIKEFNKKYPNVKITYVKKQYSDYERTMVDAIASEEGPDIFVIQNDWLPKHKAKISPPSEDIIDIDTFSQTFTDAAYNDLVSGNKLYGIPLYFDDLALFYNSKMFNDNNIYTVPTTWDEVITISKILTEKTPGNPNEITQSGIALGTSDNVSRAGDILTALMLQTNTPIISQDNRSFTFHVFRKDETGEPYYPGINALEFYTSFADPTKGMYSWSSSMGNNITAFAQGRVGMLIGYQYFGPLIQKENPNASFKIAPLPQIKPSGEHVTLANYWGYAVSRNSKYKDLSWEFLVSIIGSSSLSDYLQASGRISPFRNKSENVFGEQKSIAKTIFKGNSDEYDQIFNDMINDVVKYNQPFQNTIDNAALRANEMLARYQ